MDVLKITPPFFYSYQCGSTLLTSYIPVHMYSISFQILTTIVTMIIIFSFSNMTQYPRWLLTLLPGVCWPSHWHSAAPISLQPRQLIEPHQIISRTMNNIILLLSFGLCSPVLCCYITVSICVHLCCWLKLIDHFVSLRLESLSPLPSLSTPNDRGNLVSQSSFLVTL
jgi:hypothetical protein